MGGRHRSFPATPRAGCHTFRVLGTKIALSPLSALGSEDWSPVCFPASFWGRLIPTLNPSNQSYPSKAEPGWCRKLLSFELEARIEKWR